MDHRPQVDHAQTAIELIDQALSGWTEWRDLLNVKGLLTYADVPELRPAGNAQR